MSNLLHALPTAYRSHPVIPYAPNADADRPHQWDWTGQSDTIASGLTTASVDPTFGTETFTLAYSGLTRADVRAIESFVETQAGRKTGFWCPSFQRDFFVNSRTSTNYRDTLDLREWGYIAIVYQLDAAFHHFAAYRSAAGLTTPWALSRFTAFSTGTPDGSGIAVQTATADSLVGSYAGDNNVWGLAYGGSWQQNTNGGLALMRLMFVRFADDAITTEWDHPALANVTLRVVTIPGETP